MQFYSATENHKYKTTCVDTFHIRIPLHILTQGIFEQQKKSYKPILTFIVKTEPKVFKETLLLLMIFMSSFWKISYFNSLFEEKFPKP